MGVVIVGQFQLNFVVRIVASWCTSLAIKIPFVSQWLFKISFEERLLQSSHFHAVHFFQFNQWAFHFFIADFASTLTVKKCRMDYSAMLLLRNMLLSARNMPRKEQLPAVVKIVTISKCEKNLYDSLLVHRKTGWCAIHTNEYQPKDPDSVNTQELKNKVVYSETRSQYKHLLSSFLV